MMIEIHVSNTSNFDQSKFQVLAGYTNNTHGTPIDVIEIIQHPEYNDRTAEIFPTHICAGEEGRDACHFDSGGP
jgi:hypothetical protein